MTNESSSLVLLGVGSAGCAIARGVSRAFGDALRYALLDTDAATGAAGGPFTLLGGARLSGRGAGGDSVAARFAAEESVSLLDASLEGVRLAVVVTALGGGTGSGATPEVVKYLSKLGIPSAVFATLPFAFEGDDRRRAAQSFLAMIELEASATFPLHLDTLVQGEDNMQEALRRAVDTVATGVTLFWRLLEKPGYIRLDTERIRHLIGSAGRGRFATVSAQGPDRAATVVDLISRSPALGENASPVRTILCGVLAGDDLRLSEIGLVADGLRNAFGRQLAFELGTVNDEATFSGRLSVVVLLLETREAASDAPAPAGVRRGRKGRGVLEAGPAGRGRFNNSEPTVWQDEDLDLPTYLRRNITLEF